MTNHVGKWSYSTDEETYHGNFDSREEAIAEMSGYEKFWTGQIVDPTDPEDYLDADLLLEHIQCQDDYSLDVAEDCLYCTKEDREDLTQAIRETFRQWMIRRGVTLGFWLIDQTTVQKHINSEG